MKITHQPNLIVAVLAAVLLVPATAAVADETDHWHFDASVNLFMAGLGGDVTVRGVPAKVDTSFGDVLENLEGCAAGRFTVGYDRWSLSTEFSYMRLGVSVPAVSVELRQWLLEPSLGYRFCDWFEGFAGVRYNSISGDVTFNGPLGKVATGTQDWWDPIVGAQLSVPLVDRKLTLDGRFDIGGFGVGSDLTWQAYPYLNWHFAKWGSAQLGYRWLGTDYETGSGANKFRYDMVVQGPQLGLTFYF
jgi:hypothetical protein